MIQYVTGISLNSERKAEILYGTHPAPGVLTVHNDISTPGTKFFTYSYYIKLTETTPIHRVIVPHVMIDGVSSFSIVPNYGSDLVWIKVIAVLNHFDESKSYNSGNTEEGPALYNVNLEQGLPAASLEFPKPVKRKSFNLSFLARSLLDRFKL